MPLIAVPNCVEGVGVSEGCTAITEGTVVLGFPCGLANEEKEHLDVCTDTVLDG